MSETKHPLPNESTSESRPPRTDEQDDVEGHNIGAVNPILARELSRAREQDVARAASRNSLIGEIRRAVRRKP